MPTYTDGVGRCVTLTAEPQRIVSLCPSQTETLFALGVGDRVVGRTHWCIHPAAAVAGVEAVGGTKKVNLRRLAALAPDFILCEKEENTPALVAACEALAPTYVTNVVDLPSALAMIETVGHLVGVPEEGQALRANVEAAWETVPRLRKPLRCAYLIWQNPWMAAGADTYINSVLARLGFDNVSAELDGRYPEVALSQLQALAPDVVLLSSEPYAFTDEDVEMLKPLFPTGQVCLVDGEWFSWYGSRMLGSASRLGEWLARIAPEDGLLR